MFLDKTIQPPGAMQQVFNSDSEYYQDENGVWLNSDIVGRDRRKPVNNCYYNDGSSQNYLNITISSGSSYGGLCFWVKFTESARRGFIYTHGIQFGTWNTLGSESFSYKTGSPDRTEVVSYGKDYNDGEWHFMSINFLSLNYFEVVIDGIAYKSGYIDPNYLSFNVKPTFYNLRRVFSNDTSSSVMTIYAFDLQLWLTPITEKESAFVSKYKGAKTLLDYGRDFSDCRFWYPLREGINKYNYITPIKEDSGLIEPAYIASFNESTNWSSSRRFVSPDNVHGFSRRDYSKFEKYETDSVYGSYDTGYLGSGTEYFLSLEKWNENYESVWYKRNHTYVSPYLYVVSSDGTQLLQITGGGSGNSLKANFLISGNHSFGANNQPFEIIYRKGYFNFYQGGILVYEDTDDYSGYAGKYWQRTAFSSGSRAEYILRNVENCKFPKVVQSIYTPLDLFELKNNNYVDVNGEDVNNKGQVQYPAMVKSPCAVFDGTNYIDSDLDTSDWKSTRFEVSFKFKINSLGGAGNREITGYGTSGAVSGWGLEIQSNTFLTLRFVSTIGGVRSYRSNFIPQAGIIYDVSWKQNNNVATVIVNGIDHSPSTDQGSVKYTGTSNKFQVGRNSLLGGAGGLTYTMYNFSFYKLNSSGDRISEVINLRWKSAGQIAYNDAADAPADSDFRWLSYTDPNQWALSEYAPPNHLIKGFKTIAYSIKNDQIVPDYKNGATGYVDGDGLHITTTGSPYIIDLINDELKPENWSDILPAVLIISFDYSQTGGLSGYLRFESGDPAVYQITLNTDGHYAMKGYLNSYSNISLQYPAADTVIKNIKIWVEGPIPIDKFPGRGLLEKPRGLVSNGVVDDNVYDNVEYNIYRNPYDAPEFPFDDTDVLTYDDIKQEGGMFIRDE